MYGWMNAREEEIPMRKKNNLFRNIIPKIDNQVHVMALKMFV